MAGQGNAGDGGQREQESARRLGEVLLRTAGELGYHQTTVGDVLERSGESRERFYSCFSGREECFTAAYKWFAGDLAERMLAAGCKEATWCQGVGRALEVLLDFVAAEPAIASALTVEVRAVRSATVAHEEVLGRLAQAVDQARREPGARAWVPPRVAPLMVGAVESYLRTMLVLRESERAPDVLGDLVFHFVINYFGEEAAFEAMDSVKDR